MSVNEAYSWVSTHVKGCNSLLERAVVGGYEDDGTPLYVGRAWHKGDLIPCKVNPRHGCAYVSFSCKEVAVTSVELYCKNNIEINWVPGSRGNVPPGAVLAGQAANGEKLFTARAKHNGSLVPGKKSNKMDEEQRVYDPNTHAIHQYAPGHGPTYPQPVYPAPPGMTYPSYPGIPAQPAPDYSHGHGPWGGHHHAPPPHVPPPHLPPPQYPVEHLPHLPHYPQPGFHNR